MLCFPSQPVHLSLITVFVPMTFVNFKRSSIMLVRRTVNAHENSFLYQCQTTQRGGSSLLEPDSPTASTTLSPGSDHDADRVVALQVLVRMRCVAEAVESYRSWRSCALMMDRRAFTEDSDSRVSFPHVPGQVQFNFTHAGTITGYLFIPQISLRSYCTLTMNMLAYPALN